MLIMAIAGLAWIIGAMFVDVGLGDRATISLLGLILICLVSIHAKLDR